MRFVCIFFDFDKCWIFQILNVHQLSVSIFFLLEFVKIFVKSCAHAFTFGTFSEVQGCITPWKQKQIQKIKKKPRKKTRKKGSNAKIPKQFRSNLLTCYIKVMLVSGQCSFLSLLFVFFSCYKRVVHLITCTPCYLAGNWIFIYSSPIETTNI